MNNVLGAVLGISVTLQGMSSVIAGIRNLNSTLGLTSAQVSNAVQGLKMLSVVTGIVGAALVKAGNDESMRLLLQGVTGSADIAANQIRFIRAESEKGLFDKDEIYRSIRSFDETGASIKRLLPLAEALSLRGSGDLGTTSRALANLDTGGIARLGGLLRSAGLSVRELRAAGLHISETFKISDSPARALAAIQKALGGSEGITKLLEGSFDAKLKGFLASITELFRSLGSGPVLAIGKAVLDFLTAAIKGITYLNDKTEGWLGFIVLAITSFLAIRKVIAVIQAIIAVARTWAVIQAAIAAFSGNYAALAIGTAILVGAGVGVSWYNANHGNDSENDPDKGRSVSGADRGQRRSSFENTWADANRRVLRG